MSDESPRSPALRWAGVVALVLGFILLPFALFEDQIAGYASVALGRPPTLLLGSVVAGLLALDVLLPVPSSLVGTASGVLFGWALGALIAWLGMTLGCVLGWALGRSVGRAGLRRFVGPVELARAEQLARRFGDAALLASRPVPVLAEASVLLAGACGVAFRRMLLLTALSNAGVSLAYATLGALAGRTGSFLLVFAAAVSETRVAVRVTR